MLAALAQATSRIRVGCQVTGMIYRHPAVLANMAATTDIISGGRLELGLGAGWNQLECDAYGIELPPLKERFDRFDEGVEAIVALLTQETDHAERKVRPAHRRPLRAQAGAAAPPAHHHRRRAAGPAPCGPRPAGRSSGTCSPRTRRTGSTWPGRSAPTARRSAATRARSPARSTSGSRTPPRSGRRPSSPPPTATPGPIWPIMNLPLTADPGILAPLAEALAPLAG